MPFRIGFDVDGVLADFGAAFHEVEAKLFGPGIALSEGQPEQQEEQQEDTADAEAGVNGDTRNPKAHDGRGDMQDAREARRRRDSIWDAIQSTPNFWSGLQPLDVEAVPRIHELMLRHKWEVFFITQRPRTEGDTVQRQTQQWLVAQGFDLPSVLVLGGSRGAAARALRLDYHVDDSAQNCLDVIADSRARPILIVPDTDEKMIAGARKLGVATARSIREGLDILEQATTAHLQPGLLARIAAMVGWK
jgi:FMN phosphatase YigB (HAD superfamily)